MAPLYVAWYCSLALLHLKIFICHITAAGVDEEALKGLSRDDLKDLFPGPGNFLRRKKLWEFINQNVNTNWNK